MHFIEHAHRRLLGRFLASDRGEAGGDFGIVLGFFGMIAIPAVAVAALSNNGTINGFFTFLGQ